MSSSEVPGPNDPILLERLLLDLLDPDLKGHALFELCKMFKMTTVMEPRGGTCLNELRKQMHKSFSFRKNIVFLHLHIHPHPLDLSMSLPSSPSLARGGKVGTEVVQAPVDQKMTSVEHLVLNLCDPTLRDRSLEELSKKEEMFPDLAPLLWYSFGTIAALLQEILRIYPALSPPTLTSAASTRVRNVLALFQCIATRPETRSPFIKADILSYLYPFLRTVDKAQPFELLRVATLGVIGALVKDENNEATKYLLQCETIPLCLNIMEIGNEPSKTVSTFILLKVLRNELGLHRCCDIHGPFYAIALSLQKMVNSPDERPSARLLKCIIQCYIRLFDNPRGRAVLKTNLPIALRDGTFNGDLMKDPSAQECLQQLLAAFRRWKDNPIMP